MKIPKSVKIGNRNYVVNRNVKRLAMGPDYSAEIDYINCAIDIATACPDKEIHDFMHEVMHGIFDFCGYKDHDEEMIDRLAAAVCLLIQDNPAIFERENE